MHWRVARGVIGWAVLVTAAAALASGHLSAQTMFERLVMPGPLVEGHAKLEKDCANCHEPFAKPGQTRLCVACHKEIGADRSLKRGFHGKRTDAATAECRTCHSEHKGRKADIVPFDRETFDHASTNFELRGAHGSARCEGCHTPGQAYRKAPATCIACHRKGDPHKGNLGETCQGCHSEDGWAKVKPFDHGKTRFPLLDAHAKVACASCHANERYKGVNTTCVSCHAIQDVHKGRYGAKCDTCHAPKSWASVRFDHAKATRFPLNGGHARLKCDSCHKADLYRDKLSMACVDCHRKDDPHKGQLGARCSQCHTESGWRQKVRFDHDLTRFPLVGLHVAVPCEECHRTATFKDAPRACANCHKDTHHAGRMGTNCASCHNPNGWNRWRFDHDKQTAFPLTGGHKGLQCQACHRDKASSKPSQGTTCHACHASDDAHQGSFGRQCDTCHGTASFRDARQRR